MPRSSRLVLFADRARRALTGIAMQSLLLDIRYAARSLKRTPAFTLVAIVTLALGIGANTAIFSLVNAVLLRPLPYENPERLISIDESANGSTGRHVSGHEFAEWRDQNRVLDGVMTYEGAGFNLTGNDDPRSVFALSVSSNYFSVLGVRAELGRVFANGEDRAGANHVVVLSDALWRSRFAADSNVIGRAIFLNDEPHTVIGVMGARAFDPGLWVPMDMADVVRKVGKHSLSVVGRLKPGVTLERAREDLNRISLGLAQRLPEQNTGHLAVAVSLYETIVGEARRPVLIVLGAVAFVLLIACANVAHLLLTRATSRQREIALRTALGASRRRLVTQLLTESLMLSFAGGLLGLLLATWIVELAPRFASANMPRLDETAIDGRVLAATALCVFVAAVLSGVLPALRGTSPKLGGLLNEGSRASSGIARRLAGFLVVSEVALALVLLVGAGLTIRSLANLAAVNPGFDTNNVLLVGIALPRSRYAEPQQHRQAIEQLVGNIAALPQIASVGTTTQFPLTGQDDWIAVDIEGRPAEGGGRENSVAYRVVNANYFGAMRIPLRSGRTFLATDSRISIPVIRWYPQQPYPAHFNEPQAAPVAVINETMARRYWPHANPLGKRFKILESPHFTVVGVVADIKHRGLGLRASPEVFLSDLQEPTSWATIAIRTNGDAMSMLPAVRAVVRAFDKNLPLERVKTLETVRDESVGSTRLNATLLGAFGALALVMAVVGIYGVISYSVAQRTHEIGIRSAIGASGRDVVKLILGNAVMLTATGVAIGAVGALSLSRLLESLLFDIKPGDPITLVTMALVLGVVALLASYIPARRAMRVDPVEALRAR